MKHHIFSFTEFYNNHIFIKLEEVMNYNYNIFIILNFIKNIIIHKTNNLKN